MTDYLSFQQSSSAALKNNDVCDETRSPATPSEPQNFESGEVVSSNNYYYSYTSLSAQTDIKNKVRRNVWSYLFRILIRKCS